MICVFVFANAKSRFSHNEAHLVLARTKICKTLAWFSSFMEWNIISTKDKALPSPWLKFRPEGEISLSHMNWLMMDYIFPTFPVILTEYI